MTSELPRHYRTHVLTAPRPSFLLNPYPSAKTACLHSTRPRVHQSGSALRLVPARPSRRGPRHGRPAASATHSPRHHGSPRSPVGCRARGTCVGSRYFYGAGSAPWRSAAVGDTDTTHERGLREGGTVSGADQDPPRRWHARRCWVGRD